MEKKLTKREEILQSMAAFKWPRGSNIQCKICSNIIYHRPSFEGIRCTKCGTKESITSHTALHKLRFPVEKVIGILTDIQENFIKHYETNLEHQTIYYRENNIRAKRGEPARVATKEIARDYFGQDSNQKTAWNFIIRITNWLMQSNPDYFNNEKIESLPGWYANVKTIPKSKKKKAGRTKKGKDYTRNYTALFLLLFNKDEEVNENFHSSEIIIKLLTTGRLDDV